MKQLTITDKLRNLNHDIHWGVVIYNQIVSWTAFAILAMFIWECGLNGKKCFFIPVNKERSRQNPFLLPLAQFSIANFSEGSFLNSSWGKKQMTRRYVEAKGRLHQTGCAHRTCLMGKLMEEKNWFHEVWTHHKLVVSQNDLLVCLLPLK